MMDHPGAATVYLLCLLASAGCAALLLRTYRAVRTRLLLWTAISFGLLAINNLLLVADMVIFPQIDLWPYRQLFMAAAMTALLFGFIWEAP